MKAFIKNVLETGVATTPFIEYIAEYYIVRLTIERGTHESEEGTLRRNKIAHFTSTLGF